MAAVGLAALSAQISASNRRLAAIDADLVRRRRDAEAQRDQTRDVTEFLVSSFRKPNPEQEGSKVTVAEVLSRAIKDLDDRPSMAPATRASILDAVALTYLGLGLVPAAVDLAEQAVAIRRRELGEDHHQTRIAMGNLAQAYEDAGRLDEAIKLNEQVMASLRIKLGEDHPDTLNSMNNLALAYTEAGRPERAIPLGQQALEGRRAAPGREPC